MHVAERVEGHRKLRDASPTGIDESSVERMVPEREYSWLVDYVERLEGKEARREYYARLERGTRV